MIKSKTINEDTPISAAGPSGEDSDSASKNQTRFQFGTMSQEVEIPNNSKP